MTREGRFESPLHRSIWLGIGADHELPVNCRGFGGSIPVLTKCPEFCPIPLQSFAPWLACSGIPQNSGGTSRRNGGNAPGFGQLAMPAGQQPPLLVGVSFLGGWALPELRLHK